MVLKEWQIWPWCAELVLFLSLVWAIFLQRFQSWTRLNWTVFIEHLEKKKKTPLYTWSKNKIYLKKKKRMCSDENQRSSHLTELENFWKAWGNIILLRDKSQMNKCRFYDMCTFTLAVNLCGEQAVYNFHPRASNCFFLFYLKNQQNHTCRRCFQQGRFPHLPFPLPHFLCAASSFETGSNFISIPEDCHTCKKKQKLFFASVQMQKIIRLRSLFQMM